MATAVTFKSGDASSGGNNASGELILQTGANYGTGASTITFKTRVSGADINTAGALQDTLTLNTANEVVVTEGKLKLGSTLVTATAAELNILDGDNSATSTTLVDDDRVIVNDDGTMKQVALSDVSTYIDALTATSTATLTNKTLTAPKIANGGFIADANGNEQLVFTTTASAINNFSITNSASGNSPSFNATGDDSDVGITFTTKGSGAVTISGAELDVESYAAIGNGSALSANSGLIIDYDKTYTGQGQQLLVKGAVTGAANTSFYGASIEPESCTVPSGTTSLVASLRVKEPVITATGTLYTAATVYIEDAPTEGGNNYALLVDAGATRLDGDVSLGNDLSLTSDSAVLHFGADSEITLTHNADKGLVLKNTSTTGNSGVGCVLTLQTGDTVVTGGNVLGQIDFQAPNEGDGTDAILVAAGIAAVSETTFSSSVNSTKLSFRTAASETASEKMSLSSGGNLTVTGSLTLLSAGSTNSTTISAHTNATGTATYYLPAGDGSANQVLKTDGSGNLSWVAQGSGGTIDGLSDAKKGGSNFGNSMIIGHTNVPNISGAINNLAVGFDTNSGNPGPLGSLTEGDANVMLGMGPIGKSITTGSHNVFIGYGVGRNVTEGGNNVFVGGNSGNINTTQTGSHNVIVGKASGQGLINGGSNTILGSLSARSVTSGNNNVIIGKTTGDNLTTGNNNTIIGKGAGAALTTGSNNTVIGQGATASATNVNNEITLGNGSITELRCADTTITSLSDARDKTDVIDLPWGLDFVDSLRPVQFTWDRRVLTPEDENWAMNGKKRAGFLAQELKTSMTDNANDVLDLVYESNPDRLEVKMGKLVPMLTQAIKELKTEVDTLKAEVAALKNA